MVKVTFTKPPPLELATLVASTIPYYGSVGKCDLAMCGKICNLILRKKYERRSATLRLNVYMCTPKFSLFACNWSRIGKAREKSSASRGRNRSLLGLHRDIWALAHLEDGVRWHRDRHNV